MQFDSNHIYHIFNRGNNSQQLFFNRKNYIFFLEKIKQYILPYADILAWCLMPNHFHLMVYVNKVEIPVERVTLNDIDQVTSSHLTNKRKLNNSIAIMLRSYTRAIQKQENRTGSLFQSRTKAICLTQIEGITPAWFQTRYGTSINIIDSEKEYPQVCFNYIHLNPVKGGIVKSQKDWEFSSYLDYVGKRNGKLINKNRANEFGLRI